jgi:enamine deaminase RidA (YjgF/YER057c/UK114 family)
MGKTPKRAIQTAANGTIFYSAFQYPISRAVQAGDFVITSAFGCYIPEHDNQVFTTEGISLSTGKHRKAYSFADEVHGSFKMLSGALADCKLGDVVDCQVWLKDARDFAELNRVYIQYFNDARPARSVFQNHFMMEYRIEMK